MKIVYMIENITGYGGLQRIIVDKANALAAKGVDVILMTAWKGCDTPVYRLDRRVRQVPLNVTLPPIPMGYALALPILLYRYNREMRKLKPDVVIHFHAVGAFLVAFGRHFCHTIFESHGVRSRHIHLWLFPLMERKVDTLVTLTEGDAKEYYRAHDVRVIPNFSDFHPRQEIDYTRKHCVFANRLTQEKNPLRLLGIWKEVSATHPDWVLDIYGSGEMEEDIRTYIHDNALQESVVMHGYTNDTEAMYGSGSIFVLTSTDEGFSLSLLESMICGMPAVSLDTPYGPQSLIVDGRTGFLADYDDDQDFITRLSQLMDNEQLRRQMGQAAKERARLFDKDAVIQQWQNLFNTL